jgi:hypothetical protein
MKITQPKEVQQSLRKLEQDILSLQKADQVLSLEEVQGLYQKISETKSSLEAKSSWFDRIFGDLRRITKMEHALQQLIDESKRQYKASLANKKIWELKRKGFFSAGEQNELIAMLKSHCSEMNAIHSSHGFAFATNMQETHLIDLIIYTLETDKVFVHTIQLAETYLLQNEAEEKSFDTPEQLLTFFVAKAIPLSQLQEISLFLKSHATTETSLTHLLSMQEIEEKLTTLLKNYPQGAYIIHPTKDDEKNALILSRIHGQGTIDHLKIDLGKNLGQYTICDEKQTRLQFKRRLEQMGVPLQIRLSKPN